MKMSQEIALERSMGTVRSMDAKKFAMWLFIVTVSMVFLALTSAYIVKQSDGNWRVFEFPELFKVTSVIMVISSVTMHWAYLAAKRNNLAQNRLALVLTTLLAIGFVVGQWMSWGELVAMNVHFTGDHASASFIYVFTGLHVLHLLGGIVFLVIMLTASFQYKVHSKSMIKMEMCATYWHFLGGLWLYLYLFLIFNN